MAFPTAPKPGNVPTLTYQYIDADQSDDDQAHHHVKCRCKWFIRTSSPVAARRAAQSHATEHLARMIFDPEPAMDD